MPYFCLFAVEFFSSSESDMVFSNTSDSSLDLILLLNACVRVCMPACRSLAWLWRRRLLLLVDQCNLQLQVWPLQIGSHRWKVYLREHVQVSQSTAAPCTGVQAASEPCCRSRSCLFVTAIGL